MFRQSSHFWVHLLLSWAILFTWAGAAQGGMEHPYPPDIRKIKERGRLIVAQYGGVQNGFFEYAAQDVPSREPYYSYKGQRLVGVDIALACQIAAALDVNLELDRTPQDFDTVCERVALGKADMGISKLSATIRRAQYVRFTEPYAQLRMCLLVDRVYETKAKMSGRVIPYCRERPVRIGIWKRSALENYLRHLFPNAEAVPYDTFGDQVQALLDGKIHFVLDDELEVVWYLKAHPELFFRLRSVAIPNQLDPIAIAVSPESPNLLALLNLLIKYSDIPKRVKKLLELE